MKNNPNNIAQISIMETFSNVHVDKNSGFTYQEVVVRPTVSKFWEENHARILREIPQLDELCYLEARY